MKSMIVSDQAYMKITEYRSEYLKKKNAVISIKDSLDILLGVK